MRAYQDKLIELKQFLLAFMSRRPSIRSPKVAAKLFSSALRPARRKVGDKVYTILAMQRPGLYEDALSIIENSPKADLILAPPGIMKAIASGFLPLEVNDHNYINHPEHIEAQKRKYRDFLYEMLLELKRKQKIDVIISGNFCYFAEREAHAAASAAGIPFIVVHKESLKSKGRRKFFCEVYRTRRGQFGGRHIIVYNEFERELQIASGVVSAGQVNVCGMPRLDRIHEWRMANSGQPLRSPPTVLFFMIALKTGLPRLKQKEKGGRLERLSDELEFLSWRETATQTLAMLPEFARSNPHVDVIIKCKHKIEHLEILNEMFPDDGAIPANLKIILGGDPFELLQRAWVVVGMNSTAILEAIALGKRVISPAFGEAAEPAMMDWISDFGSQAEKMPSVQDMRRMLEAICSGAPPVVEAALCPEALSVLDEWAGNPDGKSGERVWRTIETIIEGSAIAAADGVRSSFPQ